MMSDINDTKRFLVEIRMIRLALFLILAVILFSAGIYCFAKADSMSISVRGFFIFIFGIILFIAGIFSPIIGIMPAEKIEEIFAKEITKT